MHKIRLSFGCWDYDRTRALTDGRVSPDGIDLVTLTMPVEETFFRMLRYREFDVAEMSMSSYLISLQTPERPFIALPVFVSRFFRHSCIYINIDAGIAEPKDLVGKRIGNPEYQMTAPAWIRGILADEHDVPADAVTYFTGGEEEPNRSEKLKLDLPSNIRVERIGPHQTLSQMLRDGEIDALYTARKPSTYSNGNGPVTRLFPDYVAVEREYYRRTGIFPIMHVVALRREVYDANPWVAMSLYKAFVEAQKITYRDLAETAALKAMVPWLNAHVEEAVRDMGPDFWPYGLEKNRTTLETFLRYHHEQGLSKRRLGVDEMFARETLDQYKI